MSLRQESNLQPSAYKAAALPIKATQAYVEWTGFEPLSRKCPIRTALLSPKLRVLPLHHILEMSYSVTISTKNC